MEKNTHKGIESLIGKSYTNIAEELLNSRKNIINTIINNRTLPEEGLDEITIQNFLNIISCMDSNNGINHIGIGEREGRIFSKIVNRINCGLVHGMGDVTELQPKAVGSSFLVKLTKSLVLNLLHFIGLKFIKNLLILPFATGMSITLSFLTLKSEKPTAKYVIWPRIDQKTCFKSIFTADLVPIVIEPVCNEDELNTNIEEIENQIEKLGAENILCIFSTSSCFAPRGYDNIKEISIICKKKNIFHLLNNAYGIYCTKISDILNQSDRIGNIDIIVSSTDKNFMVPVGGSLIYSSNTKIIDKIKKNYPGRASIAPIRDLFITLLEMGKLKYLELIAERKKNYKRLKDSMQKIAEKYGENIIENPNNKISIAMTLRNICKTAKNKNDITYFGSLFYYRQISGIRVIAPSAEIDFNGYKFKNYGSHCQDYKYLPYCSFAAGIGLSENEVINIKFIIFYIKIESFVKKFSEITDNYISNTKKCLNINEISSNLSNIDVNKEDVSWKKEEQEEVKKD